MSTLYVSHDCFINHQTPQGHPERPDRIRAVQEMIADERFDILNKEEAEVGTDEVILLAHPLSHLDHIKNSIPQAGLVHLDPDTSVSAGSLEAMMRGVGASTQAVDRIFEKKVENAFCAIRPPGHHAEKTKAMGFCLVNNAAIAARYAQKHWGIERVAIVDFDVHHGNGTQDIFYNDASVLFASTHQFPLYPGTGSKEETGVGNIVNAPLNPGDGGDAFREAVQSRILPALNHHCPELIIISAGFDGHARDSLAHLQLLEEDYVWMTQQLMEVADKYAENRILSMLEGGYDLQSLCQSTSDHIITLMKGHAS